MSKAWFGGTGEGQWDAGRVAQFRDASLDFLRKHFPDQQLRYVVAHADEEAYHIHFVVAVWVEKITANRGRHFQLRPGANPLLASYEHTQDLAGEHFAEIGLQRGMRRAAARRAAREAGTLVPEPRYHVPPSEWRAREIAKGEIKAKAITDAAHEERARIVQRTRDLTARALLKTRTRARAQASERTAAAARDAAKYLSIAEAAREHAHAAERERDAAQKATARLEEASVQVETQCAAMERRAIQATEIRIAEEGKARQIRETQTALLTTSRQIKVRLNEARRDVEHRKKAVDLREQRAAAFERGISYIAEGGIAWDDHAQTFAVDAELLSVDRDSLNVTVRTAGPLFRRVAGAVLRAARMVLGRAQAQISEDASILTRIRVEMGLPPEGRLSDILERTRREVDPTL